MIKRAALCVAMGIVSVGAIGTAPAFASKTIDPAGVYTIHSPDSTDDGCQLTIADGAQVTTGTVNDSCLGDGYFTVTGKTIAYSAHKGRVVVIGKLKSKGISSEKNPGAIADGTSGPFDWYATKN
jgi:hypothetical protein